MEPSRLLIAGDTHDEIAHLRYLLETAVDQSCDVILQLGDLCYYPHTRQGHEFLQVLYEWLVEFNIEFYWIDGNHTNFSVLYDIEWPIVEQGFWRLRHRFFYIPRGLRWTWSGVRFLGIGGAHSTNKEDLLRWEHRAGVKEWWWWPQERVTPGEVARVLADPEPVDVLITHDVPSDIVIPYYPEFNRHGEGFSNRQLLRDVLVHTEPKLLYHGHLHHRYHTTYESTFTTEVNGLGCYGQGESSWCVLDLKEFRDSQANLSSS